jgi:hypothetical protein
VGVPRYRSTFKWVIRATSASNSVFSVSDLRRWHDLLISCVEIDYLLIQCKIMFHLIQRFHIQIDEICLRMECATLNKETISQSKLSCELYS